MSGEFVEFQDIRYYKCGDSYSVGVVDKMATPTSGLVNSQAREVIIQEEINGCMVTDIGHYAFHQSNLVRVEIWAQLSTIYDSAFSNCRNLEYINIPPTVSYIGMFAFDIDYYSSGISPLTIEFSEDQNEITISDKVFSCNRNYTIIWPIGNEPYCTKDAFLPKKEGGSEPGRFTLSDFIPESVTVQTPSNNVKFCGVGMGEDNEKKETKNTRINNRFFPVFLFVVIFISSSFI